MRLQHGGLRGARTPNPFGYFFSKESASQFAFTPEWRVRYGLEPTTPCEAPVFKTERFPIRFVPMAVPTGFEPAISALTTLRLKPLDDGTNKGIEPSPAALEATWSP